MWHVLRLEWSARLEQRYKSTVHLQLLPFNDSLLWNHPITARIDSSPPATLRWIKQVSKMDGWILNCLKLTVSLKCLEIYIDKTCRKSSGSTPSSPPDV